MRNVPAYATILMCSLTATPKTSLQTQNVVEVLGSFSNVQVKHISGEVHSYGYQCDLYKQGNTIFGVFFSRSGLDGDPPRGRIQDVKYNSANGSLSFRAKLTMGIEFNRETGKDGRPSRDLFEFKGRFSRTVLQGSITHKNGYHMESPGQTTQCRLRLDPKWTKSLRDFLPENYESWVSKALFQGPQW